MDSPFPNQTTVRPTIGRLHPGPSLSRYKSSKQLGWGGRPQYVQDLLLNSVQLGKLPSNQASICVADVNDAVLSKCSQDSWHRWPQMVSAFWHQAVDRFLSFGQHATNLSLNQSCDQASDHDQEDQADNSLRVLQEDRSHQENLIGQSKTVLDLVLSFRTPVLIPMLR
jgi:hypothetical protein